MAGRPKRRADLARLKGEEGEAFLELLAQGLGVDVAAKELKITKSAAWDWVNAEENHTAVARAREMASDYLAQAALQISDNLDGNVNRDRLRVDMRKWLAAKYNPKVYGEKTGVAVQVNVGDMHLDALRHSETVRPVHEVNMGKEDN